MIPPKITPIHKRNPLEKFLFQNIQEALEAESFSVQYLCSVTGVSMQKMRTLARMSPYSSYIRGTVNVPALVLVNTEALQKSHKLLIQETNPSTWKERKEEPSASRPSNYNQIPIKEDLLTARNLISGTVDLVRMLKGDVADALHLAVLESLVAIDKVMKIIEEN